MIGAMIDIFDAVSDAMHNFIHTFFRIPSEESSNLIAFHFIEEKDHDIVYLLNKDNHTVVMKNTGNYKSNYNHYLLLYVEFAKIAEHCSQIPQTKRTITLYILESLAQYVEKSLETQQ